MFNDSQDEFDRFFATDSVKCPNCAANIFFNEKIGKLVCGSCGGIYEPESLKSSGRFENRDTEDAGDEEENKQEFICDSCGAAVVTDYNTAATFCAFCGSPTLIKKRLSKSFRPDLIIPFKVSKEEAIANFRAWAKQQHGVPKEFMSDATLTKITGYYVPFWLIDADCHAVVGGSGKIEDGTTVANFFIDRDIKFHVKMVPFDGCQKIPNTLMEAIEPFDYKDLKYYNDMYLPGFYAQRYDKSAIDMLDIIKIRIDSYAAGIVKHFTTGEYTSVSVGATGSFAENFSQLYALMPVWFLNIKHQGINYSIAVNGQTGEASGNLPVASSLVRQHASNEVLRWGAKYLAVTAAMGAVLSLPPLFGLWTRFDGYGYDGGRIFSICVSTFLVLWFMTMLTGLSVIVPFLKRKFKDRSTSESVTIDRAPDVGEYIDYRNGFDMQKNDKFSCMTTADPDGNKGRTQKNSLVLIILKWIFKD